MPSGRRFALLPLFGMYTRLTGRATNGSELRCTRSAKSALASGVSTTSPSTPAVKRPALRSVTRRTLKSVFARERSINLCRLRTLGRSPACDAVKIRCRNRRTLSSTARQSTSRQSRISPSGPFTTTFVAASNLSSGSGVIVIFLFTGSPDRVSTLSRPGTCVPYPAGYPRRLAEGPAITSRFPVAFRLPALASRSSDSRRGVRPSSRSAYRTRHHARTPTGLPRFTRTSFDRGGYPLYPEDGGALPDGETSSPGPRRFSAASPCTPLRHPIGGASGHETSTEVHAIYPSGLPLACGSFDGTGPLGLPPSFGACAVSGGEVRA